MSLEPPSVDETRSLLSSMGIRVTRLEASEYQQAIADSLAVYDELPAKDAPDELTPSVPLNERIVSEPTEPEDDLLNAWTVRYEVRTTDRGSLAGTDVAIKDNIALAGVPLTCGSELLSEYVPAIDATVVSRLLEAGATITGTTTMDNFSFSGAGNTSDYGPMLNPHDRDHLAGGSSGGSAAAVANGDVDIALGCDQGGSVRVPAAWSGCIGLKPTHGLVPYTGIVRVDNTIDTVGPLARTVEDVARCLEVISGADPLDPRQSGVTTGDYVDALETDSGELTVAVVEEGFGHDTLEPVVEDAVTDAVGVLEDLGATVESVSIPEHATAYPSYMPLLIEGAAATMEANGLGHGWEGYYDTEFARTFAEEVATSREDLSFNVIAATAFAEYASEAFDEPFYGRAQNLRRRLRSAYDAAFGSADLLALPTTPQRAFEHDPALTPRERFEQTVEPSSNAFPFNATGHPAISVPCAKRDGLPIGLQLVGRHFDEETVLVGAHSISSNTKWRTR